MSVLFKELTREQIKAIVGLSHCRGHEGKTKFLSVTLA